MVRPPSLQCLTYLRQSLLPLATTSAPICPHKDFVRHAGNITATTRRRQSRRVKWLSEDEKKALRDIVAESNFSSTTVSDSATREIEDISTPTVPRPIRYMAIDDLRKVSFKKIQTILIYYQHKSDWRQLIDLYYKYYGTDTAPSQNRPTAKSFHCLVRARYAYRDSDFFKQLMHDISLDPWNIQYDLGTINTVLHFYVKQGHLTIAQRFFWTLCKANYHLDTTSFNTILNGGRCGAGNRQHLRRILAMMEEREITADAVTYNTLIAAYGHLGMIDQVHKLFEIALEKRIANTYTFNTIIAQHLQRHNWDSAWSLLLSMTEHRVSRDEATYAPFLVLLTRNDNIKYISDLMEHIRADKIAISTPSFNIILHKLLFSRMYDDAQSLVRHIIHRSIRASDKTFETISKFLDHCSEHVRDHPLHASLMQLMNLQPIRDPSPMVCGISNESQNTDRALSMTRSSSFSNQLRTTGQTKNLAQISSCVDSHMRLGDWQGAMKHYSAFEARGVLPPSQVVARVVSGLVKLNRLKLARQICETAKRNTTFKVDQRFQTTLLGTLRPGNVVEDIRRVFRVLSAVDIKLDIIFFTAAAWRLYRDERFPEAISLFKYVFTLGLALDVVAWTLLIQCYGKTKYLIGTVSCLQAMKDNKLKLDRTARRRLRSVVESFDGQEDSSQVDTARTLLTDLAPSAKIHGQERLDTTVFDKAEDDFAELEPEPLLSAM